MSEKPVKNLKNAVFYELIILNSYKIGGEKVQIGFRK